ncbi:MAG: ABC transporter substrate-binding protein [Pseudomonadota bacterium]
MKSKLTKSVVALGLGSALAVWAAAPAQAMDEPKRGGVLNFVVGSKIPSYDGHAETTFGMIHPIRPFYSLLYRVNPDNPQSPTDFQCDVCEGDVPMEGDAGSGGLSYTFKIRKNIEFHDGTKLNAHDVVATFQKIVFPPEGVRSSRVAFFGMVESITAPDDWTVNFKLKYPSGAFVGAVGMPFNFIYAKKDIERKDPDGKDPLYGYKWHQKNINGTGPFVFKQHQPGAFVEGTRFANYHFEGKPYLDGFKSISAPKMAIRLQAIRGNRAAIEFRGFPPKARDDLISALGDKITVQESDWNCGLLFTLNHKWGKFQDARVRRALNLAVDRWGAQNSLSQIAIVKTAGGIVFPSHPLAASKEELQSLEGFWPDIKKSRAEAKRLLKEAGAEGMSFVMNNRASDQPYRIVGTWLIGEFKKVGLNVKQNVIPTSPWINAMRNAEYEGTTDANCQSVVNPIVDVAKYVCSSSNNRANCEDPVVDDLFAKLNREGDAKKQYAMMRELEKRTIQDEAHEGLTLWWRKINPHRSYVKGWNIAPSHYLNQHLDQVWLDEG